MKFGFKSFNHWDPLKKCLIGSVYPTDFFADHPDTKIADSLSRINQETREDLDNLEKTLQQMGVKTYRSDELQRIYKKYSGVKQFMEENGHVPKPVMSPRDDYIVIGNHLVKTAPESSYDTTDAPWAGCEDFIQSPYLFEAPSVMRAGRDLMIDTHPTNGDSMGFQDKFIPWYNENFNTNFRGHIVEVGGHSDGTMCLVKPGLIISDSNVEKFNETYPGWKVIHTPRPENEYTKAFKNMKDQKSQHRFKKYWIANEEGNNSLHEFIDLWLNKSVGYVFETNFDVNALGVNEKTIISSGPSKELEAQLKQEGVELVVSKIRHRYFWDGGVHCVTVDLERDSTLEDYFPDRGDKNYTFGRIWKDGKLRKE